jgi:hypothetical protein
MMVSVLLLAGAAAGLRSPEHYSRQVAVEVVPGPGLGGVPGLEVRAGPLVLALTRDDALLAAAVGPGGVRQEAERLVGGTLYSGQLAGRADCPARAWVEAGELQLASASCPGLLWLVERGPPGQATLHRRPQEPREGREAAGGTCRLFIHTDPFLWRHLAADGHTNPRAAAVRLMVEHVLAANSAMASWPGSPAVQLAGWRVDDDSRCEEEDSAGEGSGDVEWLPDITQEYEEYAEEYETYREQELEEYNAFINDESEYEDESWSDDTWAGLLAGLRNPTNRTEAGPEEEDMQQPGNASCYEDIDGVVEVETAFCRHYAASSSPRLLNMFSTVDHSDYCLAHLWTYRDLDVVGLADSPTDVSCPPSVALC